ncbi:MULTISPECIES: 2-oxoacid:acceptor oxidoreductase family protein [Halanaerobium]|jgi:2-oxoglutarate ferredoxin oxidoreductase subunit gamma|uniref:2-oxoglutarate ferredoxin oxidoreductase, gamma subunit n=1 Tax=Halanaerobium kushneri TaxID=56779 RepID=A0A1N7AB90_9FIRM|nr:MULTISPECIES: 2-oxoacid:acceptor oxidoreductase family protein [Halanaerobium]RCW54636.1 2-oxoglutarate ferredoxin oxidoreductase gamma subunit [Halanaerobium sp. ST460_2HS_T2]SIR36385.1 2-oxoglutarate ferredoxin oxidoreductase, gamma subunit [Halanaerobium kushneri]
MNRYEIRLSGAGGQGMILAGKILAEAGVMVDNLNISQSQSYGPESRGGASRSEIVFDEDQIDFPKVIKPDLLVCLTQESFDQYGSDLKSYGVIIVDSRIDISAVRQEFKDNVYQLNILDLAARKIGEEISANMIVLGVISRIIQNKIPVEFIKKAIIEKVPPETIDINMEAFDLGFDLKLDKRSYIYGRI